MRPHPARTLAPLLLALAFAAAPACGDDPQGSPYAPGELGLAPADAARMDAAAARYDALRADLDPAASRLALIAELAAQGLTATLGDDATSVRVAFPSGAAAALLTDEVAGAPLSPAPLVPAIEPSALTADPDAVAGAPLPALDPPCDAARVAAPRPVALISAATATHPSLHRVVDALSDALVAAGWDELDLDRRRRTPEDLHAVLPDTLLDLEGYGLTIILARTGRWRGQDGDMHTYLACCTGGSYGDLVAPERLTAYLDWQRRGLIAPAWVRREDGTWTREVTLRDDLFDAELEVDRDAIVHVVGSHGASLALAVGTSGGGTLFGWQGALSWDHAVATEHALLAGLLIEPAESAAEALERLAADGLAAATSAAGTPATLTTSGLDDERVFPHAWLDVSLDLDDPPATAAIYDVTLSFPECPSASLDFELWPGVTRTLEPVPPRDAVLYLRVRDADGKLLATGVDDPSLGAGANTIGLRPCTNDLRVAASDVPAPTAAIEVSVNYDDNELSAPAPVELAPGEETELPDLASAPATLTAIARDDGGRVVAREDLARALRCGANDWTPCFAWLELSASTAPAGTERVFYRLGDGRGGSFALGETQPVYGFTTRTEVHLTADFVDHYGAVLATDSAATLLADCGPAALTVAAATYGLTLESDRPAIPSDGATAATITATARVWRDGDVLAPSGDPVPGVAVLFHTDLGRLVGTNPVTTDADGVAQLTLVGAGRDGQARVGGAVLADGVEARREAVVEIGAAVTVEWFWERIDQLAPGSTVNYALRLHDADGGFCPLPEGGHLRGELTIGGGVGQFWSEPLRTTVTTLPLAFSGCNSLFFTVNIGWNAIGSDLVTVDVFSVTASGVERPFVHASQRISTVSGPIMCYTAQFKFGIDPFVCPEPGQQSNGRSCSLVVPPDLLAVPAWVQSIKTIWVDHSAVPAKRLCDSAWTRFSSANGTVGPPSPTDCVTGARLSYCATSPTPSAEEDEAAGCGDVAALGAKITGCHVFSDQPREVLNAAWAPP